MVTGLALQRIVKSRTMFASFLLVALLAGCDSGAYSPGMVYPLRDDPIIMRVPSAEPPSFARTGEFAHATPIFKEQEGKKLEVPKLAPSDRKALESALTGLFGRPAAPVVATEKTEARDSLKLDEKTLAEGSKHYRRHCLHCHGLTGNGLGPTAPWVDPHPRDYRPGKFKFTSTAGGDQRKPRREDLLRTLKQGIEGTSMPSFGLLPEHELDAMASYVIHLSLRGQVELDFIRELATNLEAGQETDFSEEGLAAALQDKLNNALEPWLAAEKSLIVPGPYAIEEKMSSRELPTEFLESVSRGHKKFTELCLTCHADYGRRDTFRWDDWGTVVRPANLTVSSYRGGRRPVDIYWRVRSGINGTPMPATPSDQLKDDEVWDIVNFVRTAPFPRMLPEGVRQSVYPKSAYPEFYPKTEKAERKKDRFNSPSRS